MRIRVYRHTEGTPNGKRVCVRHLPVKQTCVWFGPIFILVQRDKRNAS